MFLSFNGVHSLIISFLAVIESVSISNAKS
ncbi:hypothetical protein ECTW09098_0301, partial [Escherichia coli TW09098]